MSTFVTASVPARLHLGFLDLNGGTGRRFGSIGLPLSEPETVVSLAPASSTRVEGPDRERAARHLETLCRHLNIRARHRLVVEEAIPPHRGLGSGTQMAVAVAAALRTLHGLPVNAGEDARFLGRGERSGIGIAAFDEGGLIVDAGRSAEDREPPVVSRIPFPRDWRVILILDHGHTGIHGQEEIAAFRALPPFPAQSAAEICRRVLMQALPAAVEEDLEAFGAAIEEIQIQVGSYFAPAQGGIFASKQVERVARRLAESGAAGIGQSSWGPTGFAFAPSEEAARDYVHAAHEVAEKDIEMRIVRGRNDGAGITRRTLGLLGS
ncbi:beta-ribofuranosylaminobenzene 5'-phosphate synthase family protein [Chelativorans sp. M5D2P16]|uniref:beta-ribofuranosylaminobenzene 5'-phosphate synthase family protein n=1 Tax=Chelativorans sp. M5D2P16 TaxID=3095678 RepID=UPI002ACA5FD4|nr:beta-ribofuranosylaminobenzene 5'-phosphate synthase family protein [Chelativorans sp. M5D2P16]MDZ5696171.1 beta-ribofuranosylaminobenzene 5'-phosphate synthase family protein [Chelativorans sp. M5D2P16]